MTYSDEQRETYITEACQAEFDTWKPQQKPALNSWLNEDNLEIEIEEAMTKQKNGLCITNWVDTLPSNEKLDEICKEVGLRLELSLQWKDEAAPGSDKRDLIFFWE